MSRPGLHDGQVQRQVGGRGAPEPYYYHPYYHLYYYYYLVVVVVVAVVVVVVVIVVLSLSLRGGGAKWARSHEAARSTASHLCHCRTARPAAVSEAQLHAIQHAVGTPGRFSKADPECEMGGGFTSGRTQKIRAACCVRERERERSQHSSMTATCRVMPRVSPRVVRLRDIVLL